jgi:hypothetical protein
VEIEFKGLGLAILGMAIAVGAMWWWWYYVPLELST